MRIALVLSLATSLACSAQPSRGTCSVETFWSNLDKTFGVGPFGLGKFSPDEDDWGTTRTFRDDKTGLYVIVRGEYIRCPGVKPRFLMMRIDITVSENDSPELTEVGRRSEAEVFWDRQSHFIVQQSLVRDKTLYSFRVMCQGPDLKKRLRPY